MRTCALIAHLRTCRLLQTNILDHHLNPLPVGVPDELHARGMSGSRLPPPTRPDGFNATPAPFGVSFTGMACSEPRLIELAYAFEQATKRRVPPPSAP